MPVKTLGILEIKLLTVRTCTPLCPACIRAMRVSICNKPRRIILIHLSIPALNTWPLRGQVPHIRFAAVLKPSLQVGYSTSLLPVRYEYEVLYDFSVNRGPILVENS